MNRFMAILAVIVFCLAAAGLAQAQGNPFVGTWKMDPQKSKASPNPGPKEETRVVETQGDSVKGSYEVPVRPIQIIAPRCLVRSC